MFKLPAKITVTEAPDLWASLCSGLKALLKEGVDGVDVIEIDTAGLQILLELKSKEVSLHNPSDVLIALDKSYLLNLLEVS